MADDIKTTDDKRHQQPTDQTDGGGGGDDAGPQPVQDDDAAAQRPAVKRISPGRSEPSNVPLICDFKPFTVESLMRIRERIEEEARAAKLAKELKENPPGADEDDGPALHTPADKSGDKDEKEKPKPNQLTTQKKH